MASNPSIDPDKTKIFFELTDLRDVLTSIWHERAFVAVLTIVFMILGILVSATLPTFSIARVKITEIRSSEMQPMHRFWEAYDSTEFYFSIEKDVVKLEVAGKSRQQEETEQPPLGTEVEGRDQVMGGDGERPLGIGTGLLEAEVGGVPAGGQLPPRARPAAEP